MSAITRWPADLNQVDNIIFFEDFLDDQSDIRMVDTVTDSGSVAIGDARGGIVTLTPSDGTVGDNDEAYLASPNEIFLLANGKPLNVQANIQFSEANTDDANIAVGVASAPAANLLVDNGGGLRVTGSILGIQKVDGGTVWQAFSGNNGTVTTTTSTKTAGGSAYQTLEIETAPKDSLGCYVLFKVDGDYLKDTNGNIIRHSVLFASQTEMAVFLAVKNGGTNLETLLCDYIAAWQKR